MSKDLKYNMPDEYRKSMPDKLTVFNLFHAKSKWFFPFLGFVAMINGVWTSALLVLLNNKISGTPLPYLNEYDWLVYLILLVVSFIIAALFQSYMIKLTNAFGVEMHLSIFDKLRFTNYENYKKLGEERLRMAMMDVHRLQSFPNFFLSGFNAAITVIIGISYLFWTNKLAAAIVIVCMIILTAIYFYRNEKIRQDMDAARTLGDVFHANVLDFARGFREVKMSIKRSDNLFHKFLKENRLSYLFLEVRAFIRALGNELVGSYAWYVLIGFIVFILPVFSEMTMANAASFLVIILFLMGPINMLIGLMDMFIQIGIAINRLNQFNAIISKNTAIAEGHGDLTNINENFIDIRFENITYAYRDENNNKTFEISPLNINIEKGECIFITGGNGSGKSTFINLLSGLLIPSSGFILLNNHLINRENTAFYRDQFACIFTDNYFFSADYDRFDLTSSNKTFVALLKKMRLDKVISLDSEKSVHSITRDLSKGQQKRMALIYAILEGKDIFIFDEWAAEQDPEFRRYFYRSILPDLKQMGKTIIAVTHDDAYFDCAERIIKFDYGAVASSNQLERLPDLITS